MTGRAVRFMQGIQGFPDESVTSRLTFGKVCLMLVCFRIVLSGARLITVRFAKRKSSDPISSTAPYSPCMIDGVVDSIPNFSNEEKDI